jgi:small subunit ribosomal protein S2
VIALVDTNCDPDEADYVVPGNDDAIKACELIIRTIADSIEAGKQKIKVEEFESAPAEETQPEAPEPEASAEGAPEAPGAEAPVVEAPAEESPPEEPLQQSVARAEEEPVAADEPAKEEVPAE